MLCDAPIANTIQIAENINPYYIREVPNLCREAIPTISLRGGILRVQCGHEDLRRLRVRYLFGWLHQLQ